MFSFSCDVLHNIDGDSDIIVQSDQHLHEWVLPGDIPIHQNTEVLGFRLDIAKEIIVELKNLSGDLEMRIYELMSSNKYKIQVLPRLELSYEHDLIPRSDGSFLTSL